MADRIRSTIEFYNGRQVGKRIEWRLSSRLYHPNSGNPESFRTELETMITETTKALKVSGVRYWYNGARSAGMMVVKSVDDEQKLPRLLPCTELLPTSDYVYRIFLAPDEKVFVSCFRVVYGHSGLIESLSPVEETEPSS